MGNSQNIVVTGIGVVSPIGTGISNFWHALLSGKSGIKSVSLFDTSHMESKCAGEITDFNPEDIIGEKGLRNLDRATRLSLCAAKLALDDADYQITEENCHQIGVALGSTLGSVASISKFDQDALTGGARSVNPALFPNTVINSPASQISIRFNVKGFNATISTGFTSGISALEYASNFIRMGRANAVLVGGAEELCELLYKGFYRLGFLSRANNKYSGEISAPFDLRRNGAILGEGACIFLLESVKSATERNAKIYARIDGTSSIFDPKSRYGYDPKGRGLETSIMKVLRTANVSIDEIDYVASSANSTLGGDSIESKTLNRIFGQKNRRVVASASKSMIGETFSAGGAFQLATALMSIKDQAMHPTINFEKKDARCEIDCVPNISRASKIKKVLVPCISPTGQSSSVLVSQL